MPRRYRLGNELVEGASTGLAVDHQEPEQDYRTKRSATSWGRVLYWGDVFLVVGKGVQIGAEGE